MTVYNIGDLVSGTIIKGPHKGKRIIGSIEQLAGKDLAIVKPLKVMCGINQCLKEDRDE